MSREIIRVENLSKTYKLGTIGYGTIKDDLRSWWAKVKGKDDPNAPIDGKSRFGQKGFFKALDNINFSMEQGDRLGIVGRNGAGKSTLLKILSRITAPTQGNISIRGKIASLLEVGTGFHPELTGRDNVFLNGAILGMKRAEIQSKFNKIVEFSEIGDFIDTPVKRYSSGMYVRLAFSVAAHLDSDILILDEVLAVGDGAFQKKCIEKIKEVSIGQGRSVIFVSHAMGSVNSICNKGLLLADGRVAESGNVERVTNAYNESQNAYSKRTVFADSKVDFVSMACEDEFGQNVRNIGIDRKIAVSFKFKVLVTIDGPVVPYLHVKNDIGTYVFVSSMNNLKTSSVGLKEARCEIPANFFNNGIFSLGASVAEFTNESTTVHFFQEDAITIEFVEDIANNTKRYFYKGPIPGPIRPDLNWTMSDIKE